MKPNEIIEESFIDSFKRTLAVLAVASSFGNMVPTVAAHNHNSTYSSSINIDKELTYAGREAIKNLPDVIKNKLGDINTIVFVSGIPEGGSKRAVCQVAKGTRIVYVNPKFRQIFLNGASDQLTAHELTHIAQSNMSRQMQDRFPETDPDENKMYGNLATPDAWKILISARKNGNRMWNHSREEQAMIVQLRTEEQDSLDDFIKSGRKDGPMLKAIQLQKKKISVYDSYINDYDE